MPQAHRQLSSSLYLRSGSSYTVRHSSQLLLLPLLMPPLLVQVPMPVLFRYLLGNHLTSLVNSAPTLAVASARDQGQSSFTPAKLDQELLDGCCGRAKMSIIEVLNDKYLCR